MTAAVPPIYVEFKGNVTNLTTAINKAKTDISKFGKQTDETAKSVSKSSGMMKAAFAAVSVAGLVAGFKSVVMAASNLEESVTKANVVFGSNASAIQDWAKTTSTSFGINRQQALEAAGTYGNLLRAFGMTENAAYSMSTSMVELAADLASFNNTSVDDALNALRAGLTGETEPLKRFGVALTDVRLRQEALAMGLGEYTGMLPPAIKTQAAYSLIMKDTSLAQGDMARTAGGFANQLRFVQAGLADAKTTLGEAFLPVLVRALNYINENVIPTLQNFINGLVGKQSVGQAFTDSAKKAYAWGDVIRKIIQTVVNYKKYIIAFGGAIVAMWMIAKVSAASSVIIKIIDGVTKAYKVMRAVAGGATIASAMATGGLSLTAAAVGLATGTAAVVAAMAGINAVMGQYNETVESLPTYGAPGYVSGGGSTASDVTLESMPSVDPMTIGGSGKPTTSKAVKREIAAIKKFLAQLKAAQIAAAKAIKSAPDTASKAQAAASYVAKTKSMLEAAKEQAKETKGTKAHAAAVKALAAAQAAYNAAVKQSKELNAKLAKERAAAAQKAIDEQNRLYRALQRTREASRSWLAATARASGPTQANFGGFIEVPVVIDGQTVFRATQRYSLINNQRNVTNGLATSGSLI